MDEDYIFKCGDCIFCKLTPPPVNLIDDTDAYCDKKGIAINQTELYCVEFIENYNQ